MAMENSTQAESAGSGKASKRIALRQVSQDEWAAIPRTIPGSWVAAATWLPLVALLVACESELSGMPSLMDAAWKLVSFSMIATVFAMIFAGGRQTPWMGLGVAGVLGYLLSPTGAHQVLMLVALGYFLLLALVVGVLDARFRSQLKSWKHEATASVELAAGQERHFALVKHMSPKVWQLSLGALAYALLRLGWELLSTEVHSLNDLDEGYRLDAAAALAVLAICLLICVVRWTGHKSMGLFAVEIPADPKAGAFSLRVFAQAICVADEETADCTCRSSQKNETKKKFLDSRFIFSSADCAIHGIEAVNQLNRDEFLAVAHQPWVYGANLTGKLLDGSRQRMIAAGLSGWGSRPIAVRASWLYGGGKQISAYFAPNPAREPMDRKRRRLQVIDLLDNTIYPRDFSAEAVEEIDRIDLRPLGIQAQAVRVRGGRPFII